VMELYPVGERFFQEVTFREVLLNAAKDGSGRSAAGTSSQAEGPNTAEPAATTPCARGDPGAKGRLCPYREHALISRQHRERLTHRIGALDLRDQHGIGACTGRGDEV
jgi:hypothetical protein